MASDIESVEISLRKCPDIHARLNFTALRELNDSDAVLPILLENYRTCLNLLEEVNTRHSKGWTALSTTVVPPHHLPALVTYFVLVSVFGLVINLCVIGTICRVRRLWTITNAFVLSLAMADFFMASGLVPLNIWCQYYPGQADTSTAKDTLFPLLGAASLLNLAGVTLERFVSISYPLRYDAFLNRSRATVIIVTIWLVSIFQALLILPFKDENGATPKLYEDLRFALVFGLPCLSILLVNMKIYYVALQHARQINASNPDERSGTRSSNRSFIKKLKTVKIIALLVGTFMVTWFPYFCLSMYEHHIAEEKKTTGLRLALQVAEALTCGTALFNPLLYGLLRKDVREAIWKGLKCENVNQTELQSFSYSFRMEKTQKGLENEKIAANMEPLDRS